MNNSKKISKQELMKYLKEGIIYERQPNKFFSMDGKLIKTKEDINLLLRILKKRNKEIEKYMFNKKLGF
jgi:hypothetical protein